MSGSKYDDMVQALTPDGANNAFRVWVLPWRTISRHYFLNTKCPCPSGKYLPVDCIAIAEQILRSFVHAASLNQLLRSPRGSWMVCNIEMQDPATVITQNGTDKLTSRLVKCSVYARFMRPPHISKTQRRVVGKIDNFWPISNAAPD